MARVIWRYRLPKSQGLHVVDMPKGAEALTFDVKDNELNVWMLIRTINIERPMIRREFVLAWTGREDPAMPPVSAYVGSVQTVEGRETIVWHLFDLEAARG